MNKSKKNTSYDPAKIEPKWRKKWARSKIYKTQAENKKRKARNKYYILDMFPYPSGEGLHVGHPKGYIATDVVSRMKRMQGYNVLHPMGFDAFGLPAENYAIKTKTNPEIAVKKNVARYKKQLEILGFDYDWSREVNTTDPKYYKWTQWIFLQLWKKGLAYESFEPINWCPSCKTGLANEDVEDGRCERCGTPVEKKPMRQWVLKITDYADRLLEDLDATDYVMPVVRDNINPHRDGVPIVERNVVHAIVYDPKTKKFLIIRNKKHDWDTVIIGGIEDGENPVDTAIREVREETGYTDLEFKKMLGGPVQNSYYTKHKGENRVATAIAALFELKSDARVPIADNEDKDNEILWVDESDFVPGKMINTELPFWLERMNARVEINEKTGVTCFVDWGNTSAVRDDMPFAERNAITAIVKHWKEDKYIGLKWKKVAWKTLITGGPDGDETPEQGAMKEIIEETGYLHPKFVKHLGKTDSKFFHNPKNVNRYAHFDVMYFELKDGERNELTDDEKSKHEVVWLTKEEMSDFLSPAAQRYMWDVLFLGKPNRFTPTKPLLDWPESIKESQRNWIGKSEGAEVDFHLVVPNKKTRFVILHGYKGSAKRNFIPWLKSELEKLGHEVETPELPNSSNPIESEQVDYVLRNCHIDENTVVIGHSLGAIVAMKLLMKLDKSISGLVLVAAAMDPESGIKHREYWESFDWNIDYGKINKLTDGKIAILSDLQEKHRAVYLRTLSKKLNAKLVETNAKDEHFCDLEEPEILKIVTPSVKVFTTRPDTIFGVTYLVLAPEHEWVKELLPQVQNRKEVEEYIARAKSESEMERTDAKKEKTGVELKGVKAINPANGEEVPVWIADYVLPDYGTGAVMAVPAHDERDWEFVKKFGLPIRHVVAPYKYDDPKPGKETEKRDVATAIVRNPKDDTYLCLKWKTTEWQSFPSGGIEGGNWVDAAKREIIEETGYKNIKFIEQIGDSIYAEFYRPHKDSNVFANFKYFLFELENEDRADISEKEKSQHEVVWVKKDEVANFINVWNQEITWKKHLHGDFPFMENGLLINSGQFNEKKSDSTKKEITSFVGGRWVSKYKLRDWVFSRQRYWGEPIPVVHCDKCGVVAIPEKDLPVKLPRVKSYEPTGTGESPLASIDKWVNVKCPKCKGPAKRETNTMPQWAGSSWYYLRYEDPKNSKKLVDAKKEKYWSPVDLYVGGAEHATRHLIYARFWHKFLRDIGVVSTIEPFKKLQNVGLIMGEDGRKMSKRFGNVVNPDDIVNSFGADTMRVYEMFMGPFDQSIAWNTDSMVGARRFIERVWKLSGNVTPVKTGVQDNTSNDRLTEKIIHKTIKKVTDDISTLKFNTAISALMIAGNELEKAESISQADFENYLKLLAPFAPHVAEELWASLGNKKSIHISSWPTFDPALTADEEVSIVVQVNGKVRGSFIAKPDSAEDELKQKALNLDEVKKWIDGKEVKKVIVVKDRVVSVVI